MAAKHQGNRPIIIKRVTVSGEGGHHGGAWKVAYADFVTAMMAFFLLMWLLNATTEEQRHGLADYFNPSINHTPGGSGDGVENGVRTGTETPLPDTMQASDFNAQASHIQDRLTGLGAESMELHNILRHVVTRMTDEGLVIELTDLTGEPLFATDSTQPTAVMTQLAPVLARVLSRTRNQLAITGHVRSYPEMLAQSPVWSLSNARAHQVRDLLEQAALDPNRVQRVTGYADRRNRSSNPMDPKNNRIEIILLR